MRDDAQPIADFRVRPDALARLGHDLARPECVLAMDDGTLFVSDRRAAVTRIAPDGAQQRIGPARGAPNGIAMQRSGHIVIADIDAGAVTRLGPDGRLDVLFDAIDGAPLAAPNFAYVDANDRLWITVSTRTVPRTRAVSEPIPDGFVCMADGARLRRVGADYCFTNEVRIHDGWLYVAETALGRVSRHRLDADGRPGARETFGPAPLFPGAKIDGIAFDAAGNLWVTEVAHNTILVLTPDGTPHVVLADPEGKVLDFPASIAFGGPDRRTAIVGSIRMDHLVTFRVPIPGAPMRHWNMPTPHFEVNP